MESRTAIEDPFKELLEAPTQSPSVFVFADESHYQGKPVDEGPSADHTYAVGAIVIEGRDVLESMKSKLQELRDESAHDPSLLHHDDSARILRSGWHLTQDQLASSIGVWQFIGQSVGAKFHYRYFTSSEQVSGRRLGAAYAVLHAALARDLLRRYEVSEHIEYFFEQYEGLNSKFSDLIDWCVGSLSDYDGPMPTVAWLRKGESDLLALADYMILGSSRLVGQNELKCREDPGCSGACRFSLFETNAARRGHLGPQDVHFRNFGYFQKSLSSAHEVRLHPGVLS